MSTYEIYRRKALVCLQEAKKMHDPSELVVMLGIARDYLILADHVWRRHDLDVEHRADEDQSVQHQEQKYPGPHPGSGW